MSDTINQDTHYRVLARKYRPVDFAELIGQDAMVRTLSNAIDTGRLAHAFILTGVRGVGKTSTARIIAKALNCVGEDGKGAPTIEPCGICENCIAISESRHVDVMEMDAASRTGIDDIREIIEGVKYSSVTARFKIYIIDEVHMLSRNAFNALLKTLEEPPQHVKFIFATTEIRKVPVTVLSRCQRFDLRRVSVEELIEHYSKIAIKEKCEIESLALAMIARAAEGSVRDGLSLLDQAFAHGAGKVNEEQVRDMLGLADRTQVFDLYKNILSGNTPESLAQLRNQYHHGADPAVIIQDMLELTHWLTRLKVVPDAGDDLVTSEADRVQGLEMSQGLSIPILTRAWQLLLKGLDEVRIAPNPIAAAEMIIVRMTHSADLPTPEELIKQIKSAPSSASSPMKNNVSDNKTSGPGSKTTLENSQHSQNAPQSFNIIQGNGQNMLQVKNSQPDQQTEFVTSPASFEDMVKLFEAMGEPDLAFHLNDNVHLNSYYPGRIGIRTNERAPKDLTNRMSSLLNKWTGQNWIISFSEETGDETLYSQEILLQKQMEAHVAQDELVKTILTYFKESNVTDIQKINIEPPIINDLIYTEYLISADEFGLDDQD